MRATAYRREDSENPMYIGGGLLGTVLIIALIFFLIRRS
jgi:hypothetical protein